MLITVGGRVAEKGLVAFLKDCKPFIYSTMADKGCLYRLSARSDVVDGVLGDGRAMGARVQRQGKSKTQLINNPAITDVLVTWIPSFYALRRRWQQPFLPQYKQIKAPKDGRTRLKRHRNANI